MVFFMSVLVFLAGIMTYMFFPRNDAYQQQMFLEEPSIASFVNQHQAAKDTVFQLVSYGNAAGMNLLDADNLFSHLPTVMQGNPGAGATHDIALDSTDQAVANPENADVGYFTSAVACGTWVENNDEEDCLRWTNIGGTQTCTQRPLQLNITPCNGQSPKFVMTYGDLPDWWSDNTERRRAWFRALLKRTHGSKDCGAIEVEYIGGKPFYRLNTSQKYVGYEDHKGLSVIPTAIASQVEIWMNEGIGGLDGTLFCLTQIKPPYEGSPEFFWDSLNNNDNATGSTPGIGRALTGNINDGHPDFTPTGSYTLAGAVSLNGNTAIIGGESTLGISTGIHSLTIGDSDAGLTISDLPDRVSFAYTVSNNKESLTVFYHDSNGRWTHRKATRTLSTPWTAIGNINPNNGSLLSLRIYNDIPLSINRNAKTDRKRFGL